MYIFARDLLYFHPWLDFFPHVYKSIHRPVSNLYSKYEASASRWLA